MSRDIQCCKALTAKEIITLLKNRGSGKLLELLALFKQAPKTDTRYQVWEEANHPLPQGEASLYGIALPFPSGPLALMVAVTETFGGVVMFKQLRAIGPCFLLALGGLVSAQAQESDVQTYPDVLSVKLQARGEQQFDFDVTISSPYDTPQRYADGFRVAGADGRIYGERPLLHDHASEQPFTRDLYGVNIPAGVRTVAVQARDRQYGYGGKTVDVSLPGR